MIFLLVQTVVACEEFFKTHPEAVQEKLYPDIIRVSCLTGLIKSGNWSILEHLLESPKKNEDITQAIDMLTQYKKKLTSIISLLDTPTGVQQANASFRWAQSLTDVYLEVRFSHRIDTAGCVDIHDLQYKVNDLGLSVSGKCLLSGHKIIFSLNLQFFKEVLGQEAEVDKGVQGRLGFKLKKKQSPEYWSAVYSGQKPGGMSFWHDMQETFQASIDKYKRKNQL